jgi:hypothetical protein
LLLSSGVATERMDAGEVVKLFKSSHLPVPFRRVRRAGADVLVSPTSLASVGALISAASQTVVNWGFSSVRSVLARVR